MNKACYTAIADNYDPLRNHPDVPGVDWIAFVSNPAQYSKSNWDIQPLFSYGESDSRRQSKWYKVQSHLEMAEYDRTLWIDGSCEVRSPRAISGLLDIEVPIALYTHPDRDCIYQEAGVSLGMRKYHNEPIREQVQYYIDEYEYPEHWGLWFTGLILRNRCPEVERMERMWWNEIDRWSYQDQLSFPVVMHNLGDFPESLYFTSDTHKKFIFHQQPEAK